MMKMKKIKIKKKIEKLLWDSKPKIKEESKEKHCTKLYLLKALRNTMLQHQIGIIRISAV